jgi:hypothetical protein
MLKEPLELHRIGGFVICYFYGLPRTTADIDYYSAVPANLNLVDIAGEGSALANKSQQRRFGQYLVYILAVRSRFDSCAELAIAAG